MADQSVQSLDRGLMVLRLLSRTPVMTATAIAAELGLHQSSASRLLASLLKAGFVRKPDFHSFALDYGALAFAGQALNCFPEIRACTAACNHVRVKYDFQAAAGILREGKVLYLTQTSEDAALAILEDTGFPLHLSSLGLVLACERTPEEARALIGESLRRSAAEAPAHEEEIQAEAARIHAAAMDNIGFHDFIYLARTPQNAVNGAQSFSLHGEHAAVAIYHHSKPAPVAAMRAMLQDALALIRRSLSGKS